jgi:SAM-dependent methyltransferase
MVGFLAPVEDEIVRCFREGGGLGYENYPKFAKAMAIQSRLFVDSVLIEGILPLVPGLPDQLGAGIDVCDIGCGAGHALNVMAKTYPQSRFVGWDLLPESIELAEREAEEWGLANVQFEQRDVTTVDGSFDLVTAMVAVHDQAHPDRLLREIRRALVPGGRFLCVDSHASSELADNVGTPLGAWRYSVSTLHCLSVSLAQGGAGLGDCWGPPLALEMMHDAGFDEVDLVTPEWLDAFHVYVATKAGGA